MQSKTWLVRSYGLFSSFSTSDSHSSAPRLWLRSLSLSQISISISLSNFFFQWIILQGLYILYNVIVRWLFYFLFLQFDPLLLLLLLFLFWNCERVRVFFFSFFSLSLSLSYALFGWRENAEMESMRKLQFPIAENSSLGNSIESFGRFVWSLDTELNV